MDEERSSSLRRLLLPEGRRVYRVGGTDEPEVEWGGSWDTRTSEGQDRPALDDWTPDAPLKISFILRTKMRPTSQLGARIHDGCDMDRMMVQGLQVIAIHLHLVWQLLWWWSDDAQTGCFFFCLFRGRNKRPKERACFLSLVFRIRMIHVALEGLS